MPVALTTAHAPMAHPGRRRGPRDPVTQARILVVLVLTAGAFADVLIAGPADDGSAET